MRVTNDNSARQHYKRILYSPTFSIRRKLMFPHFVIGLNKYKLYKKKRFVGWGKLLMSKKLFATGHP